MMKNVLSTGNLAVGYGKSVLVNDVTLSVEAGKILTLIGPNGSGKSTVLKTITKQLKVLGGRITLLGKDFQELSDGFIAEHVSMVMTERIKPQLMTCREVVGTGRFPYTGKLGILTEKDWDFVDKALELVRAGDIGDFDFNKISDGQKQRIMLARAICQDTEVIVLDEPTSYLDLFYKLDLMKIIKRLAVEQNKAVIMSLHELDLVKMVSDFVVCIDGKKICKAGTVDEVFTGNFIQTLYGLEDDEFVPETAALNFDFREKKSVENLLPSKTAQGYGTPCRPQRSEDGERERSVEQPTRNEVKGCARKKVIMVQGTMSNAGKSLLVAGLCRIFKQDGYRVAPFKSQNMALNSFITKEGLEMGRAQVMQAEAAGIEPMVCMNPILLKPTNDKGSQVIVNGEVIGNMQAREYFKFKKSLVPEILKAYRKLEEVSDIIVIEGAGSPAEINLRENDIVNMGLAELVDAPVILVGDIDRGGVFAQLLGTVSLLEESERARIKGLVINKFRGDKSLLDSGIDMLVEKCGISVTGVLPYMHISLDDEDSLSECFDKKSFGLINIGVVRLPRISNFTDFNGFEQMEGVSLHYLSRPEELERMDFIILPGSKNTIGDLLWLRESGFEAAVKKFAMERPVFGICGGFQMLGSEVWDPDGVEEGGRIRGLELLPVKTVLLNEKTRTQVCKSVEKLDGIFEGLSGKVARGYEIHMGKTFRLCDDESAGDFVDLGQLENWKGDSPRDLDNLRSFGDSPRSLRESDFENVLDECVIQNGNVYGSYVHGFFDEGDIAAVIVQALADSKGVKIDGKKSDFRAFKESQYDLLAKTIRENMNMEEVYRILNREV